MLGSTSGLEAASSDRARGQGLPAVVPPRETNGAEEQWRRGENREEHDNGKEKRDEEVPQ